jgi:hypothetical protein
LLEIFLLSPRYRPCINDRRIAASVQVIFA